MNSSIKKTRTTSKIRKFFTYNIRVRAGLLFQRSITICSKSRVRDTNLTRRTPKAYFLLYVYFLKRDPNRSVFHYQYLKNE